MTAIKERISKAIDTAGDRVVCVAEAIFDHPEIGNQEFFAAGLLTGVLAEYQFKVTMPFGRLATAFRAELSGGLGPQVALLAEYDALPEIGHACGHNLIAAASLGAAIGLASVINELKGSVVVIGTPAEENQGAKVWLARQGYLDDLDAALMFHPGDANVVEVATLAMDALEFIFAGRPAHASSCPEEGLNALEAVIQLFNNINSLRPYLKGRVSISGIISEGGVSPNIIPERAAARFYLRASDRGALDQIIKRVEDCAAAAALATGTSFWHHNYEPSYEPLLTNRTLAAAWCNNLKELGVTDLSPSGLSMGSLDMGNVSRVIPAIHPYLSLNRGKLIPHTRKFAQVVRSEAGRRLVILAAKALAWTVADAMLDKGLLKKIKHEFACRLNSK